VTVASWTLLKVGVFIMPREKREPSTASLHLAYILCLELASHFIISVTR